MKTSPKVSKAKQWAVNGGAFYTALVTSYGRKVRGDGSPTVTRKIVYRQHETDLKSPFLELTEYQARSMPGFAPDLRNLVDELKVIQDKLYSPQFRDQVELNQICRTCERTRFLVHAWKETRTIPLPSLMPPYCPKAAPE